MKKIIIEDVQVGISRGGIACGPVAGHVVAEARIRKDDGSVSYYGLVEVDGTANFYEVEESRYDKEIADEFDETDELPEGEGFSDYDEFYEALDGMIKEDEAHALLLKYLVSIVRLGWDEVDVLRQNSIGKAVGTFEIPVCDAEEEYREERDY